jgi:hypothetical protein
MIHHHIHHATCTPATGAHLRRVCFAVLFLVLTLGPVPVARAIGGSINSPAALSLHLSDLPPGFYVTGGGYDSVSGAAKIDKVNANALAREGMLKSYETVFERGGRAGMVYVWDTVTSFRSAAGAHWYYNQLLAYTRKTRVLRQHLHPVPEGYLGDEHTGWIYSYPYTDFTVTATYTLFRRGDYVARLLVFGGPDNFFPGQALELAKLVDARMSMH